MDTDTHTRYSSYPASQRSIPRLSAARQYHLVIGFAALTAVLLISTLAAICLGAYRLTPTELGSALAMRPLSGVHAPDLQQARAVLLQIRLPRVVLALLVGAGFGAAGSALQGLFRNPLADPSLIGISSGAALGAATVIVLGPLLTLGVGSLIQPPLKLWFSAATSLLALGLLPGAAFAGALSVTALVYRLAVSSGQLALPLLLLAGIAINALAGAAIGGLTYIADDAQLRSLTFWSLGSLGGAQWRMIGAIAPFVILGLSLIARNARALNLLQLGESEAQHLGVPVQAVKRQVLIGAALSIGALVSCTGIIGFIGLVAPHCARLAYGANQRVVMPGAILLGAILTVLADLAARTLIAPAEMPLGILTALLGAPFFLLLLWRSRSQLGL